MQCCDGCVIELDRIVVHWVDCLREVLTNHDCVLSNVQPRKMQMLKHPKQPELLNNTRAGAYCSAKELPL